MKGHYLYCTARGHRKHISVCLMTPCSKRKKCNSYKKIMEIGEHNDHNRETE
jgi:hypothetical protein